MDVTDPTGPASAADILPSFERTDLLPPLGAHERGWWISEAQGNEFQIGINHPDGKLTMSCVRCQAGVLMQSRCTNRQHPVHQAAWLGGFLREVLRHLGSDEHTRP